MKLFKVFAVIALLALFTVSANATVFNATAGATLTATVGESLTFACTPSTVTFSGSSGTITGSNPISCVTTYSLGVRTTLTMTVWTNAQATALAGTGSYNIASSQVFANFNSGTFYPCTSEDGNSMNGCDNGGFLMANSSGTGLWPAGTQTDSINFQIALGSTPPGTYTGTVTLCVTAV